MRAQSERLRLEYRDCVARAKELFSKAGAAGMRRKPDGGGWTAAECLEHLVLVGDDIAKKIRNAVDAAEVRPPRSEEKLSFFGKMLIRSFEPPVRKRYTAAHYLVPQAANPPRLDLLLGRFEQVHTRLGKLIEETDAIDRMRIRITLPDSEWMKVTLFDAFSMVAAHDRRHLWQAERAARL
ncbi:MAG TPA: DinB family protein [Thermoanaerobaculia bacterium]